MKCFATILLCSVFAFGATSPAVAIDIKAREYILVDAQTGTLLDAKDPDRRMPPSSMSKLMTAYMVFTALKEGRISLDDTFTVSRNAWELGGAATEGSTMFLDPGSMVKALPAAKKNSPSG